MQYDLYYIKNNTLLFDLAILLQTVEVVCLGKGAR
jgi:lipopolysaccharide/colanic/teichoic acid biosynthesis glycosyltransferase